MTAALPTGPESSPHRLHNPAALGPALGFSHATSSGPGRVVWVAGQISSDADGRVVPGPFAEQFDRALGNVVTALAAAGGRPEHLVRLEMYTCDMDGYRAAQRDVGRAYRRHLGKWFPAMAMLGVTELFEPDATVEIIATAVVPDESTSQTTSRSVSQSVNEERA